MEKPPTRFNEHQRVGRAVCQFIGRFITIPITEEISYQQVLIVPRQAGLDAGFNLSGEVVHEIDDDTLDELFSEAIRPELN